MIPPGDWSSLSKADPEFEDVIRTQFGGIAPDLTGYPNIQIMREHLEKAKKRMTTHLGSDIKGVQEMDHIVPVRDGTKIRCRSYRPAGNSESEYPLYMIFHGGGWCLGGLENEELLCRFLTSRLGVVCFNVAYRLAPESPFPAAPNDCFDATSWAVANCSKFGADPSKGLILNGTSAGGNLAVTVCHVWHDTSMQPPVTGCHLINAPLVYSKAVPERLKAQYKSWEELKDAPILNHSRHGFFIDHYVPLEEDRWNPLFSPLLRPDAAKIMPATYQQVSGMDPLRDEELIFEKMIQDSGGKTRLDLYPGQPHGFWSLAPKMKASQKFFEDAVKGAQWLLNSNTILI